MKENLEVLIVGQGLIVLSPNAEVPLLYAEEREPRMKLPNQTPASPP
jgi:hypothetical protein